MGQSCQKSPDTQDKRANSAAKPTRPFGEITANLLCLFSQYDGGTGVLCQDSIRKALNYIQLFPSTSQVFEMIHCASECSERSPQDHITFAEFCILVTELQENYRKGTSSPVPRSSLSRCDTERSLHEERHRGFQVFLGGSCNPTRWRQDIAIPFLKEHAITFYNPQVNHWRPELVEIEEQAKQNAEVLFFVVDNQTRSTSSMVEAAYLAGRGRQLILVVIPFATSDVVLHGETISEREIKDLTRSQTYLIDLVERVGIPVFSDLQKALDCTVKTILQGTKVEELRLADGAQPVKNAHLRVGDKLLKLHEAFHSVDAKGKKLLSAKDVCLAYKAVTGESLSTSYIHNSGRSEFSFQDFCCLVAEYKHRNAWWKHTASSLYGAPGRLFGWFRGKAVRHYDSDGTPQGRDVYLGGSCGTCTWREDLAIPLLRKHGISYYNPYVQDWDMHHIPIEAAVKDNCRLLIYVITDATRAITSMLEAAHYIALKCDMVLYVKHLSSPAVVDNEELSERGIKDYNRARVYLTDVANRENVPVLDTVEETIMCAIKRLKKMRQS